MEWSTQWAKDANWLFLSYLALYLLSGKLGENRTYGYFQRWDFDLRAPHLSSGGCNAQIVAQLKQRYYNWVIARASHNGWYSSPSGFLPPKHTCKNSFGYIHANLLNSHRKPLGEETFNHFRMEWLWGTACLLVYFYSVLKHFKCLDQLMD